MNTAQRRLAEARSIRHHQAQILEQLRDGDISIKRVLERPGDASGRLSVHLLLTNTRHIGERGAEHICKRAHVWPTHRLGKLSEKERADLVDALPPRVLDPADKGDRKQN
jgi:hypothetical protein